jgi:hypothetical protein
MKMFVNASLLAACLAIYCHNASAQETVKDTVPVKKYQPFSVNLQVRNLYIWRGFKVSNAPITDVNMHYTTKDGHFEAGFWGGASFTGDYKEFDYYVQYTNGNFNVSVWDVNNFSDFPNADIFDYSKTTTSHFVDVRLNYKIPMKLPLTISWSTIFLGRDYYINKNGDATASYSHYAELDQVLYNSDSYNVHAFVGGGFAFGMQKNFYGNHPNIVNAGITVNKDLVMFKYHIPLSATAMLSPEHKYGALQLVANIF